MTQPPSPPDQPLAGGVRLDRWLWTARFYRTRALAARAIDSGKIQLNGSRARRSKLVAAGDVLRIRKPPHEQIVVVRGLAERRGPASAAQALYEETSESVAARERLTTQLRFQPAVTHEGKGRPTKKDRRDIERFKRGR